MNSKVRCSVCGYPTDEDAVGQCPECNSYVCDNVSSYTTVTVRIVIAELMRIINNNTTSDEWCNLIALILKDGADKRLHRLFYFIIQRSRYLVITLMSLIFSYNN